jgi:AcrR family transcriptional regulator
VRQAEDIDTLTAIFAHGGQGARRRRPARGLRRRMRRYFQQPADMAIIVSINCAPPACAREVDKNVPGSRCWITLMRSDTSIQLEADGRRQRSEASHRRIVRAMLELIGAGDISPSAESVADRAGLGLRTVFRHFENMDTLYQEINAAMTEELQPVMDAPFRSAGWRGRLDEMVDRRVRIFERIMPFKIAADVHRHQSAFLARKGEELTREQRSALLKIIPEEQRSDGRLFEALDLLLSFETWRRLRKDQKLSVARARRTLEMLLAALIKGR